MAPQKKFYSHSWGGGTGIRTRDWVEVDALETIFDAKKNVHTATDGLDGSLSEMSSK